MNEYFTRLFKITIRTLLLFIYFCINSLYHKHLFNLTELYGRNHSLNRVIINTQFLQHRKRAKPSTSTARKSLNRLQNRKNPATHQAKAAEDRRRHRPQPDPHLVVAPVAEEHRKRAVAGEHTPSADSEELIRGTTAATLSRNGGRQERPSSSSSSSSSFRNCSGTPSRVFSAANGPESRLPRDRSFRKRAHASS